MTLKTLIDKIMDAREKDLAPDCDLICGAVGIFATINGCEDQNTIDLIARCEELCGSCPVCESSA